MKKLIAGVLLCGSTALCPAQQDAQKTSADAVARAQTPNAVQTTRPEQNRNGHDTSNVFDAKSAPPNSTVSNSQPNQGKITGFDFYRDPLNADRPNLNPEDVMKKETANKPAVMEAQKRLLERRYQLQPKLDPNAKMSRGKPLPVGPTARLGNGMTWERLASMTPETIRQQDVSHTHLCLIPCRQMAGRCSRKCSSTCSPVWSDSMSISTFRMHSFPNFHRQSF